MFIAEELQKKIEKFRKMPSETEWLEFKEAGRNFDFRKMGKYFSALSNETNLKQKQSGWLIFGIKDKLPRDIAGTKYRPDRKSLESLKQHGEAKPKDFQRLWADKLSDLLTEKQKKAKVRNLIQEMAKEGLLRNLGGRGLLARWHLLD